MVRWYSYIYMLNKFERYSERDIILWRHLEEVGTPPTPLTLKKEKKKEKKKKLNLRALDYLSIRMLNTYYVD